MRKMKTLTATLILAASHFLLAVPHPEIDSAQVSGTVDHAIWRSGFEFKRVIANEKGKPNQAYKEIVPDHWMFILSDHEGLLNKDAAMISNSMVTALPIDFTRKQYLGDRSRLYLHVIGRENWPIKIGSKVILKDFAYRGRDIGFGRITVSEIQIDGRTFKVAKTKAKAPDDGDNKGAQQGGADPPATAAESKPQGKEIPKIESEARPQ